MIKQCFCFHKQPIKRSKEFYTSLSFTLSEFIFEKCCEKHFFFCIEKKAGLKDCSPRKKKVKHFYHKTIKLSV